MKQAQTLAKSTLSSIAVRVSVLIIFITGLTYIHVTDLYSQQTLDYLERYVQERAQNDSEIFMLAEENHRSMRTSILKKLGEQSNPEHLIRFDQLFEKLPDGTTRNRKTGESEEHLPFAYMGRDVVIDNDLKHLATIFYDASLQYGSVWHHLFQNLYFTTPNNVLIGYWPEFPNWAHDLPADFDMTTQEYVWIADTQHNPNRKMVWTGLFYDLGSKSWMTSIETPIDYNGKHIATIGNDVTLNELISRTLNVNLEGSYNIIFRDDGRMIAHPELLTHVQTNQQPKLIQDMNNPVLKNIFEAVKNHQSSSMIIDDPGLDAYLAVARYEGPDWHFVTVYPRNLVNGAAYDTASFILIAGILSLALELLIFYSVIRRKVALPFSSFLTTIGRVSRGDYDSKLDDSRKDELGHFAAAFNHMIQVVQERTRQLESSQNLLKKALEKETREAQNNRALFELSPIGLALTNMRGDLIEVNSAYANIIGYTTEECSELSYWDITPEKYALMEQQQLNSLNQTGRYGPYEKEYRHKNGHLVPVRLVGMILYRDGERFIWSSVENIASEKNIQKHLEQLVKERTQELENAQTELIRRERLATLGQLTATVSHEMRNPLAAIRPAVYILKRKFAETEDESVAKVLERIDRNITRCDHIIDELLDFARTSNLYFSNIQIDEWLKEVVKEQTIHPGIMVDLELGLNEVSIRIDSNKARRAIINIIENACHAMLNDSRASPIHDKCRLRISTRQNSHYIEISVEDNGIGMSQDVLDQIFEPLYSTKSFGVGLGMPIIKQIMNQHNGEIDIVSTPGHSTTVTLRFPISHSQNTTMESKDTVTA
ncbi:MAG: ATP-binding protein [Gammaproteobacteria bacterium]|nr:ATP-binding protein [Gammaproteobacteria bacterium]